MKTPQEVISLALPDYISGVDPFMCHVIEALHKRKVISELDMFAARDFIESQLNGCYTLTTFLRKTDDKYLEIVQTSHEAWLTVDALEYRVKWWKNLLDRTDTYHI